MVPIKRFKNVHTQGDEVVIDKNDEFVLSYYLPKGGEIKEQLRMRRKKQGLIITIMNKKFEGFCEIFIDRKCTMEFKSHINKFLRETDSLPF